MRAGLAAATGELLIIQDVDLEYDPRDYAPMLRALLAGPADIVYYPRNREQGKKIGPRDWFIGARTLWKYRNG